ncbi:MAG: hypothetical protein GY722_24115, partial [bacterium]|nr:hypothetical protein [bacterium]
MVLAQRGMMFGGLHQERRTTNCGDCGPCEGLRYGDGLGRMILEERQYPVTGGVATADRAMGYNALGWKTSTELWNSSQTTNVTHDRFGRVTEIQPPDPSLAPTLFRYLGERRIDRSDKVATEVGTEHYVCTREEYDTFGRLVRVNEDRPSSGAGACSDETVTGLLTDYAYDEADRLVHVCAGPSGETCAQNRHFTYDGRGFLTAEQHPEIGPSGNGTANYTYDASGNVLSKDISGTIDFALRYAYDPANRLITVGEVDGASTRPIKSFHYVRSNDGNDLRAGKLVLSKRINWVDLVGPLASEVSGTLPVTISQAYLYKGL